MLVERTNKRGGLEAVYHTKGKKMKNACIRSIV